MAECLRRGAEVGNAPKIGIDEAVRAGHIAPAGKNEAELREELKSYLSQFSEGKTLNVVVDHTSTLLTEARRARKRGEDEIAVILYATWVEHFVNKLVLTGSERRGLPREQGYAMLRDVSLQGKVTWLLPLIGFRAMNRAHLKTLTELSDRRNQYVHYKWKGVNESRGEANALKVLLEATEKAIRYLRRYERSVIYGDRVSLLRGAVNPARARIGVVDEAPD